MVVTILQQNEEKVHRIGFSGLSPTMKTHENKLHNNIYIFFFLWLYYGNPDLNTVCSPCTGTPVPYCTLKGMYMCTCSPMKYVHNISTA